MSRRRVIAGSIGLLATLSLVAACGGGTQPGQGGTNAGGTSGATDAGGGSGSTVATAWGLTGGLNEALYKASFSSWNEANADQQIGLEFFANDAYKEKIRTALGAGNAPTLIYGWGGGGLKEYVDNENVADITAETENLISRVIPSVAAGGIFDDVVYGVPNSQSQPVVLYYNKALLDEAGVAVPTTWDELMTAVATLNEKDIAPFSVAGQSKWPYLMWIQYLTDRVGGPEAFQAVLDGEADAWSDPAFAEALTMIQDLVKADGFVDGYGSIAADANADQALLYTGRAAFLLQGSWVYSGMKIDSPDFVANDLGFTTFPAVEGGAGDPKNIVGNTSNYWSVSATASDEAKAAATNYLDTVVFDEEYTQMLLEGGGVPPVEGMEDAIAEIEDSEFVGMAYDMVKEAPHFQLSWDQALPPDQAQEPLTNLEKVFLLQSTPEQFVDAMNKTIG